MENPKNLEDQAIALVGLDLYEKLIKGYTEKQWGRPCTEIPAFIIKRIPVRFVYDNNYFNDCYQGIPIGGYNKLISGLLKDIEVKCNIDFLNNKNEFELLADKILFTGPIDEFYGYKYGNLAYRSIRFEHEIHQIANWQGNAVINFTSLDVPYTRIIEHKHFETFGDDIEKNSKTVISKEYSLEWKRGMEPYYPVNDQKNNTIYKKYKNMADNEDKYIFGGRLAEYKYYDMAPIIELALERAESIIKGSK
ncbi:hypothetical protein L950_0203460 [Sphingobacterium sp. IITKGP-BTPF85]|nr:hypothetical protein L950_0203460 [Sphingobacterium sp. IITKGP-BTPF85]